MDIKNVTLDAGEKIHHPGEEIHLLEEDETGKTPLHEVAVTRTLPLGVGMTSKAPYQGVGVASKILLQEEGVVDRNLLLGVAG